MSLKMDAVEGKEVKTIKYRDLEYGDLAWYTSSDLKGRVLIMKVYCGFISLLNPRRTWINTLNEDRFRDYTFEPVTEKMTFVYDPEEK